MRRRLPPYGRCLAERLTQPDTWLRCWGTSPDGQHVSLWVLAGTGAWERASDWLDHRLLVVSPPESDPFALDWSLLRDHPPVIVWPCGRCDATHLERLCCALIRDGCERVLVAMAGGLVRYLKHREAA